MKLHHIQTPQWIMESTLTKKSKIMEPVVLYYDINTVNSNSLEDIIRLMSATANRIRLNCLFKFVTSW